MKKLTKKELCAVLIVYFSKKGDENNKKDKLVMQLEDETHKAPAVMGVAVDVPPVAAVAAAVAPVTAPVVATAP